jgi:2-keto-4-pentenoate hydratase
MEAQFARRRELLSSGARHLGWKAGFGSKAAMDRLGSAGPLFGFMVDRNLVVAGSPVSIAGWTRPVFEAEIAVHLGSDVRAGAAEQEMRAAIAGLGPAVELADPGLGVIGVEQILAGDIFHRHVLLGPVRAGGSIDGFEAIVFRDGQEIARTADPTQLTGDMIAVLQALAEVLEANGEALRSGDVIIAGSVVPPIEVAPGQVLRVEMSPLGGIEVRFQEVGG